MPHSHNARPAALHMPCCSLWRNCLFRRGGESAQRAATRRGSCLSCQDCHSRARHHSDHAACLADSFTLPASGRGDDGERVSRWSSVRIGRARAVNISSHSQHSGCPPRAFPGFSCFDAALFTSPQTPYIPDIYRTRTGARQRVLCANQKAQRFATRVSQLSSSRFSPFWCWLGWATHTPHSTLSAVP